MSYAELRKALEHCWDETTIYPNTKGNTYATKSRGQCYPTALLVRRLFKGNIIKGKVGHETHYWNKVEEGTEVNLTSDQYGGDGLHSLPTAKQMSFVHPYDLFEPRDVLLWKKYQEYKRMNKNEIST